MKKVYLLMVMALLSLKGLSQTSTYSTPGTYTYTVSPGVTAIGVDVRGAQGGTYSSAQGGKGGQVLANYAVTPGQLLYIFVGSSGGNGNCGGGGNSYGGGENGGSGGCSGGASGGGAASDIRLSITGGGTSGASLASRVFVGGGGGGASWDCSLDGGAAGGYPSGGTGAGCGGGGGGGTQSGGGSGSCFCGCGSSGNQGNGGSGTFWGGGGGGGLWGGGGGSAGSGGGGSSYYATAGVTSPTTNNGFQSGNGFVSITVLCNAPGTVTGTATVCVGANVTLADATAGVSGTWSSSNTAVATVNTSTGVVTGVGGGTATISYNIPSPCGGPATKVVTVNPVPGAISGIFSACIGNTTTLGCTPSGGTWTSSNTALATVGSVSGTVTGVATGTPTISYTLLTGCASATTIVSINPNPGTISGPSSVCGSLTALLSDGPSGGSWSSSNPSQASVNASSGLVTGGSAGVPTITYTTAAGCTATTPITVNALSPISGIPSMCLGGSTTLSDATSGGVWSSSNTGVATIGTGGTVTAVSIGTSTINYMIPSTGCTASLTAAVTIVPNVYIVNTPSGTSFCSGGSGVPIGLSGSDAGVTYQLYNGIFPVGAPLVGTGLGFSFGVVTVAGTYGVIANPGTSCATTMTGTPTITYLPLPTAYTVSGGGGYCAGGSGVHVFLSSSTIGINYQLFVTTLSGTVPVGSPVGGTGVPLDFGAFTTAGTYTVVGTNTSTGCVGNMSGSAVITINPLPAVNVVTINGVTTTSGSYCTGGSGLTLGLNGSVAGYSYQLYLAGTPLGSAVTGGGSTISFGVQTLAGTYTVIATNPATGCTASMSGSATISISPLPTVFTVTGGGSYCSGGTGVPVGLNGSSTGVNYQLYVTTVGTVPAGLPVAGTGTAISFGSQSIQGSYTVVATSTLGCANNMFGSVSVVANPLPTSVSVTGGGSFCSGATGVTVGINSSFVGTTYTLLLGTTVVSAASGTGSALNFGTFTTPGTYTVSATTVATGCTAPMSGSATISVNNPPPAQTVTVAGTPGGTGSYCSGGTGVVVGLNGSQSGSSYQLMYGGSPLGGSVSGTGSSISFGLQTGAGAYTVVGTSAAGCSANMTGSGTIVINPLPTSYAIMGGGTYCSGGAGVDISLAASNAGINYQLYNGISPVGVALSGTGSALDFGMITGASTPSYTIKATNATTGCINTMYGSVTVAVNPLPTVYTMTSSGSYCNGGAGYPVGLNNSTLGVSYQLLRGGSPVGSPVSGSGVALSFGLQTVAGTYTVLATTPSGCSATMAGSTAISINPLPTVFLVTGGGPYCSGGSGVHVFLNGSSIGINYQLFNGFTPMGLPMAGTGGALDFGVQTTPGTNYNVVATNPITGCTNNMSGSVPVIINSLPPLFAVVGGGNYCAGGAGVDISLGGSTIGVNYQLYTGASPVGVPLAGTGFALDFGMQTGTGIYTVLATNTSLGCQANMIGSATVATNPLPTAYAVTGGGNYCPGSTGVAIGLLNSTSGISYQLYLGTTAVGSPVPGSGSAITFGLQTATGLYTVIATNPGTSCTAPMTGNATVGLFPLPIVFNVTGGGNYCPGGAGVDVGVDGSSIGHTYQLYKDLAPVGTAVAGTGLPIHFGLQTASGNYTVQAMNSVTGCSDAMAGSVNVGLNPLPTTYNVTGGGDYCNGGTGRVIGTDGSDLGTTYQLYRGVTAVGLPLAGTTTGLNFGPQTVAGTYTIVATSLSTTCNNTMSGSATIIVDALPVSYAVTGGGNYCAGGAGVTIGLSNSQSGVYYQLYNGIASVGASVAGTGSAISFGNQTLGGNYTVVATNAVTSCTNNMTGSVTVNINPLPTIYSVTGGGNYCPLGSGVHVGLSGSNAGISYQLLVGGAIIGAPLAGTGVALDFGLQTSTGAYQVAATNVATGCTDTMSGSVDVNISSLPATYSLVSGTSNYCAGGTGVMLTLTGSEVGTSYQLYVGGVPTGAPVAGTGYMLNLGLQTTAGTYTVIATGGTTSCSKIMAGTVTVAILPLPTPYSVVGGGEYCNGGSGVSIGLGNSHLGVNYQLYLGAVAIGSPVAGTGSPISFGMQTAAGTYTVIATNPATTCTNAMSGSATITIDPLPTLYSVTGGGNYCASGTGVHVGLSGSSLNISYQLWKDGTLVGGPALGTGSALDFGLQTATGTYTVVATNTVTGCVANMTGSAAVGVNPLPISYAVTGGGNYCPGGAGMGVGIVGSDLGITYQLFNGTLAVGAPMPGTGSAIDFGLHTAAGTYTVVATNATTGCVNNMSGSATIVINTPPASFDVIGGGNYCAGGIGVHVGLNGSASGISYQLYRGVTPVAVVGGTGSAIDFGLQTTAGSYSVIATDPVTGCSTSMSGTATVVVNLLVAPSVSIATGVGDTLCSGNLVTINALVSNTGTAPVYHWTVNGVPASAAGTSYTYTPANGDVVALSMTSSAACATPGTVSASLNLTVLPNGAPSVTISSDRGDAVCQGTVVNYSSSITFGGSAPTYSWIVNGINQGAASTYSYIPGNGDDVYCVLGSNYQCRTTGSAPSNHISMTVDVPVVPDVTVTAHPSANVAQGQTVLLTATVNNSIDAPSYQWFVNGSAKAGATLSTFSANNFNDLDSVSCSVTSGGTCSGQVGSSYVILHVSTNVGVNQVTAAAGDITLMPNPNKGVFTLKGTLGLTDDQDVTIQVTDMIGQVIYNGSATAHGGNLNERIQLSGNVANGMYLLNLHSGSENKVFHIVIEQ